MLDAFRSVTTKKGLKTTASWSH